MSFRLGGARFYGSSSSGVAPGVTIAQLSSPDIVTDDFVRADGPVGGGWVEELPTNAISANRVNQSGGGGGAVHLHRPDSEAQPDVFIQAVSRFTSNIVPSVLIVGRDPIAGIDGYTLRHDTFASTLFLERLNNGAVTVEDSVGVAGLINTFYVYQLCVKQSDGLRQRADWWRQLAPASIVSLSRNNTAFTPPPKRPSLLRGGSFTAESDWEDVLICYGAVEPTQIICTGMRLGMGDKIRVTDAADVVIAEASEIAGVARIDLHAVASGLEWPLAGHNKIKLTDSLNVLLSELVGPGLMSNGVFPGQTFQAV